MSELTQAIQGYLQTVEFERSRWAADGALANRVLEVKRYQHARFAATYADLLSAPASAKAVRFFLDELYGPMDFSRRDAQFSRVAPKVATLFPGEVGHIVLSLARLHALSERLDTEMACRVTPRSLSETSYGAAWRAVGQAGARAEQIELVQAVGLALAKQVRKPLIRTTLRLMRGPAHAAGLDSLQSFLEQGFDAFRELPEAAEFVKAIATRETALAAALFAGANGATPSPSASSGPAAPSPAE